jgi:hypothetical protein
MSDAPAAWDSDFDFYVGHMDDAPCAVMLDLGALRAAPLLSHPVRLQIRVQMLRPRPSGLRSDEEADALFALEDRVVAAMAAAAEAIYVGRTVAQGYTELYFYVPVERRAAADDPPAAVGDTGPYRLEWLIEDDPAWERYRELYPNVYALQTIMNRRLVAAMEQEGDQLDVPRLVDHVVFFPTEREARAAATELQGRGFRVDPLEPPEGPDAGWRLELHREERCDDDRPDAFVFEVLDVVVPHEGDYDGWGSPVQKG